MGAYYFIFESEMLTAASLLLVGVFSILITRRTNVVRSIFFSIGMWLGPLFYILYMICKGVFSPVIILAFTLEFLFLLFYILLFDRLFFLLNKDNIELDVEKWLKILTTTFVIANLPLLCSEGYGIFSGGSRIQYLENSRQNIYLTYAAAVLSYLGLIFCAAIINRRRKWSLSVIIFLLVALATSLFSGSKGNFILNLFALLSLIKLQSPAEYFKLFAFPVLSILCSLVLTVVYVGKFLSLDAGKMLLLMLSRIFLYNDARALSIDYVDTFINDRAGLIQESFRSICTLVGYPPAHLPLGQLLYKVAFSTDGFAGANTTTTSLLIAYGTDIEKILFAIILCIILLFMFVSVFIKSSFPIQKVAIGLMLINLLSQDFLAFQLVLNIVVASTFLILIFILAKALLLAAINSKVTNSTFSDLGDCNG